MDGRPHGAGSCGSAPGWRSVYLNPIARIRIRTIEYVRPSDEPERPETFFCGGKATARERSGNASRKYNPTTAVRYGRMKHIGEFSYPPEMPLPCGGQVVIATDRGIEVGQHVPLTCAGCDAAVTRERMRDYARASGGDVYRLKAGRILREATEDDLIELRHIQAQYPEKLATAQRLANELNLDMKLADCEHVFGGERIVFYFMAEERVDFRELVRRLASEFQTRIEMRQVGARDEARLLADYETCGRECCCKSFLKTLKPVGMQMAKLQKATLDPSKVSGRCGRLKCCLRYEHETYDALVKQLPRTGSRIATAEHIGKVIDRQVLTQLVRILTDEDRVVTVAVEDITERNAPPRSADNARTDNGRRPPRRGRSDSGRSDGGRSRRGPGTSGPQGQPSQTAAAESTETDPDNAAPPASSSSPPTPSSPADALSETSGESAGNTEAQNQPAEEKRSRRGRGTSRRGSGRRRGRRPSDGNAAGTGDAGSDRPAGNAGDAAANGDSSDQRGSRRRKRGGRNRRRGRRPDQGDDNAPPSNEG